MTIAIGDLLVRYRSDTSDLQRGSEAAKQTLQGVEQQAAQTARALEIMAQAASKANPNQGNAGQILQIFQHSNVQPTATALAQAAQEMGRTAAAATQTVQPAQAVARATAEHVVSARGAAQAHQEIASATRVSETSMVRFGAAIAGVNLGLNIAAGAGRLLHDNIAASLEAAINLDRVSRGLIASYGAGAPAASAFAQRLAPAAGTTAATVGQALTTAAPLTQYGITSSQAQGLTARAADIAGRFGQPFDQVAADVIRAVQTGGNQLEQYGIKLDDARVKTESYGGALSSTFDRMTANQQIAVRYNLLLDQTRDLQGSAATSAYTLSGAFDHLGASLDRLRERSGALAAGGLQDPANALSGWLNQIAGGGTGGDRRAIVADPNAAGGARILSGPPQFDLRGLPGPGPDPRAFIGPIPLRGVDLLGAYTTNAQNLAGRAQAEAQAQVTSIQLQSDQRRLSVAEEMAGYRRQELDVQGQLSPLLERQAELQNKITLASRDNLESRRNLIAAERQAQGPQNASSDLQYADQRVQLLADVRMARVLRGQDVSDLPSPDSLIGQHIANQLNQPEVALHALDASHVVDVVQRQRNAEDLNRQGSLAGLDEQQRRLEDQQMPLQEQLRLTQQREASVQRTLDLYDLGATKGLVAAQQALNEADQIRLIADETSRVAQDYSDHMVTGATALERSASAAQATRDALKDTLPLIQQLTPGGQSIQTTNFTVNFTGPLSVRSDQDIHDIANQVAGMVLNNDGSRSQLADNTLAGARRGPN